MLCISKFVQIDQNWSKRTESGMNVAPTPSQLYKILLHCCSASYMVTKHFPQKIYKCARLVPFLHNNVRRLNMEPQITCKRADLVTMVAFVGLFPRVWRCAAWLSQKHWTLTNACVWFPFHTMSCSGQPSDQNGARPMKVFEISKRRTNSDIF